MKTKVNYIWLLIIVLNVSSACWAQTAAPQTEKTLNVSGLKESVTVRRDARGIPYIEAKTETDLYFAQGYVTAQDRLWQMDLYRRVARGETSEIFGKATLEEDKRWRKFGFAKIADNSLLILSPEIRASLEDYARGVNAYIATLDEKSLPAEFQILQYKPRQWRAADSVVIGKIFADALSTTWQNDLLRASVKRAVTKDKYEELTNPATPFDVILFGKETDVKSQIQRTNYEFRAEERISDIVKKEIALRKSSLERIGFYAEELAASNNWVVSGKRTLDGKPILANDPHLQPNAPGIWYLTNLSSPKMHVAGVTAAGIPGVILGHNDSIAWGATNVGPDVQDLYVETFDASGKYKTPTGWETPVVRKEEIKVRKTVFSPETESITLDVTETRNGVIIAEEAGKKYALRWTARDAKNNEVEAFHLVNRASNGDEFKSALKIYGGATQNFVYADARGNIGWYAAGKIPLRKTGDGAFPYDGATADGDWTGMIPFEELPNLYNPPEGFIVTANQRTVGTDYKYPQFARDFAMPWRARRIYELLKANSKVTMNDVRDAQYDAFNLPLSNLAREIVKMEAASTESLQVLRGWDGRMTPDSRAALLVVSIRSCLADKIAADNKPVPSNVIRERIVDFWSEGKAARWLPKQFADSKAFLKAFDTEARASLAKRYGADESKWVWGAAFQSRFPHPLAIAPLVGAQFTTPNAPIAGSGQTPNVGSSVSMRHISSPGNWDATRFVIPLGESGNPLSPHYKDQFEAWRTGTPMIFPFTKEAVENAAKETVVLMPK